MNSMRQIGPHIEQPTEEDIKQAIEEIQQKHGVTLSESQAEHYLKLRDELGWWIGVGEDGTDRHLITQEMAQELQKQVREQSGEDISLEEALKRAQATIHASAESEKERIAAEIRTLLGKD